MPDVPAEARFPLYLLSHMIHATENVNLALSRLDVTRAQMTATAEEVGDELSLLQLRRTLNNVEMIAGEPANERLENVDQTQIKILGYHFPVLWPEFSFEVRGNADGFWVGGGFARRSGYEPPTVEHPEQLTSWEFTISEVDASFGPLEEGDLWSPYEGYLLHYSPPHGISTTYGMDFCWGLLQAIEEQGSQKS